MNNQFITVKPMEWDITYVVIHASGGLEFFYDEDAAENTASWLGRGYYVYNEDMIARYGERVRTEKEEWEKEVKDAHVSYILACIDQTNISELVTTAQWARNRLEAIADDAWHGDARDLKRSIIGIFADFDQALANCNSSVPEEIKK